MPASFDPAKFCRRRNLITSGKNASSWGREELDYFGVYFKHVDFETFFHDSPMPVDSKFDPWLKAQYKGAVTDNLDVWAILEKIDALHNIEDPQDKKSIASLLIYEFLRYFRYIDPQIMTFRTSQKYSYHMIHGVYDAMYDTVIIDDERNYILMGIQNGDQEPSGDVRAQIIPQAISAFVHNNQVRGRTVAPLNEVLVPFMTMRGGIPTFYLIPITERFVTDVRDGKSPDYETVVLVYKPIPANDTVASHSGLFDLNNRRKVTEALIAMNYFLSNYDDQPDFKIDTQLHALYAGDLID